MERIEFDDGSKYELVSEEETIEKYGLVVPASIRDTLLVTGTYCCGKSTLEARVRGIPIEKFDIAGKENTIIFSRKVNHSWIYYMKNWKKEKRELDTPVLGVKFVYDIEGQWAYKNPWEKAVYEEGGFNFDGINIHPKIRDETTFEVRIFDPYLIVKLAKDRFREEKAKGKEYKHEKVAEVSEEDTIAAQSIIMETAKFLIGEGCDVYFRRSFEGQPLRLT